MTTVSPEKSYIEKDFLFNVSPDPFYSESNLRAINESITQIQQGRIVIKTQEELENMINS